MRIQLYLCGAGAGTGGTGVNATGLTGGIRGSNSWGNEYPNHASTLVIVVYFF